MQSVAVEEEEEEGKHHPPELSVKLSVFLNFFSVV